MKNNIKIITIFSVILILGLNIIRAYGQSGGGNVLGWIWFGSYNSSEDFCFYGPEYCSNMGWGSFSSDNIYSGKGAPPPPYGIDFPVGNGLVTGKIWVSGLGWLDFGPTSGFPTSGCSNPGCPTTGVYKTGNVLDGWAKITAIDEAAITSNQGGYDGWIKMKGIAADGNSYGVTYNPITYSLDNKAWSSDFGWIGFYGQLNIPPPSYNSADLTSLPIDTCPTGIDCGSSPNTIMWKGYLNGGLVRFQIASSDTPSPLSWNFVGPNNDPTTYYDPIPDTPLNITKEHNNKRYIKYKAFLDICTVSCGATTTPVITNIIINWSD